MTDLFYLYPLRDGDASSGSYEDQASAEAGASDLLGRVRDIKSVAIVQLVSVVEAQPIQVTSKAAADVVSAIADAKAAIDAAKEVPAPAEAITP